MYTSWVQSSHGRRASTGLVGWEGNYREDAGRMDETERRQLETSSPAFYRPDPLAAALSNYWSLYGLQWGPVQPDLKSVADDANLSD
jgi:hypothetical protein